MLGTSEVEVSAIAAEEGLVEDALEFPALLPSPARSPCWRPGSEPSSMAKALKISQGSRSIKKALDQNLQLAFVVADRRLE